MIKIEFLPKVLLRLPRFSYVDELEDVWPHLKEAIQHSSPSFYQIIKDIDYSEITSLNKKAQFTIWKYFNRAKYRATPYGHFASCSILGSAEQLPNVIKVESSIKLHEFINWPYKNELNLSSSVFFEPQRIYLANETIYYTADSFRFIFRNANGFEISAIDRVENIENLLEYCKSARSYTDLVVFLERQSLCSIEEIQELLQNLLDYQLLYTDLSPNIIGQDYFERIGYAISNRENKYLLAERNVTQGVFPHKLTTYFNECINCLLKLSEEQNISALNEFRQKFLERFEQNEVPLMRALDPELGIGYDGLEQNQLQNPMSELFVPQERETSNIRWGALEQFLTEEIILGKGDPDYLIQLDKFTPQKREISLKPANTFSALVAVVDDLLIAESIGGCTANSLLGRFTKSNVEVETLCKQMVNIEEQANSEVIFFDIAYLSEDEVDNVNRRQSVYQYELPILVFSCCAKSISVQDIFVSVVGEEIILRSKQYGKRLIPRLTTAYNYQRSDLSLYRFLCDLQHQGIQGELNIHINQKIPGLAHYPRVQFKNIVLSTAKWKINPNICKDNVSNALLEADISQCKELLHSIGASRYFKAGKGDQTLCFDQQNEPDIIAFSQYLFSQKNDFYIEEAILPKKSIVLDEHHKPYLSQFLISIYHTERIYSSYKLIPKAIGNKLVTKNILPGNEWLYFEIYCNPQKMDALLLHKIEPFIIFYQQDIAAWFFIRYQKPGHHIRFRIKLKPDAPAYAIIHSFCMSLSQELNDGQLIELELKTYQRETERYGMDLIEDIENHFHQDSMFVLNVLREEIAVLDKYRLSMKMMKEIMSRMGLSLNEQLLWTQGNQQAFCKEHRWSHQEFKKLNQQYSQFKNEANGFDLAIAAQDLYTAVINSLESILLKADQNRKYSLLNDLFHMQINRLFPAYQRMHEGIIYCFLLKELQKTKAFDVKLQTPQY